MTPDLLTALDALLRYLVLPALAWAWALQRRVGDHATELRVICRLMEERRLQRDEDREALRETLAKLDRTLTALDARIGGLGAMGARLDALEREADGRAPQWRRRPQPED